MEKYLKFLKTQNCLTEQVFLNNHKIQQNAEKNIGDKWLYNFFFFFGKTLV